MDFAHIKNFAYQTKTNRVAMPEKAKNPEIRMPDQVGHARLDMTLCSFSSYSDRPVKKIISYLPNLVKRKALV
jgi:hypothetical protein